MLSGLFEFSKERHCSCCCDVENLGAGTG